MHILCAHRQTDAIKLQESWGPRIENYREKKIKKKHVPGIRGGEISDKRQRIKMIMLTTCSKMTKRIPLMASFVFMNNEKNFQARNTKRMKLDRQFSSLNKKKKGCIERLLTLRL